MGFNLSQAADAKNPFSLPDPGLYIGYVEKGEIKVSANSGNKYINFRISLKTVDGQKKGSIFWMFMGQDWQMFQCRRFLEACGFTMEGELEFEEICNMALRAELLVAVKITPSKDPQYADKAEPDFVTWEGFYPIEMLDEMDAIINKHQETPTVNADDFVNNGTEGEETEEF